MKVPYQKPRRIMFVCLGNHCRSPLAHGYFQYLLKKHNLEGEIEVSSSGQAVGIWENSLTDGYAKLQKSMDLRSGTFEGEKLQNRILKSVNSSL